MMAAVDRRHSGVEEREERISQLKNVTRSITCVILGNVAYNYRSFKNLRQKD